MLRGRFISFASCSPSSIIDSSSFSMSMSCSVFDCQLSMGWCGCDAVLVDCGWHLYVPNIWSMLCTFGLDWTLLCVDCMLQTSIGFHLLKLCFKNVSSWFLANCSQILQISLSYCKYQCKYLSHFWKWVTFESPNYIGHVFNIRWTSTNWILDVGHFGYLYIFGKTEAHS